MFLHFPVIVTRFFLSLAQMIFRPPLDLYDVLIHLNPKHIPRHREAVDQPVTSFVRGLLEEDVSANCSRFPVVDYDPVQFYLSDLRVRMHLLSIDIQLYKMMIHPAIP